MTSLKALLAVIVSTAGALVTALGTSPQQSLHHLSTATWLIAVASILGSGGIVWFTENGPAHPYIKAVVAFLSAGVSSLVVALNDNVVTQPELLTAFIAAVTATGLVFQATNSARPPAA